MCILVSLWSVEWGWKNATTRTTRINAKQPHRMEHRPNNLGEHEWITTPPNSKLKGCAHTNETAEDLNAMFRRVQN
jgi:hypothetical protein